MHLAQTKLRLAIIPISLILLVDQASKAMFVTSCNEGIAFSLLSSWGTFNILVTIIFLGFCLYFFFKERRFRHSLLLALIIGGGVSNLVDRLIFGCVRDFIDFKIWPSFNFADSVVTVGVLILVLSLIKEGNNESS